mmetsp:Transcript_61913/g.145091  ORF Transcript_61913/g.145091 Transcript_61913/m.145091 type:complete len:279 (-) Transcript_61913:62-898(-)
MALSSPERHAERSPESPPEEHLAHISEVLRQSDLEVSSSGTSRPEQEEWTAAFRQAVGYVSGDSSWSGGEAWPQSLAANVLDAISTYVPDGWVQDDAGDSSESRGSGNGSKSDESAPSDGKGTISQLRAVRQRFDSMASTSLSDTETKEDGDETSAPFNSPRGLEAALKELTHYKFESEGTDRKTQLQVPDLPSAPKELQPPLPLKEPVLPEDEPDREVQEAKWWWHFADLTPACLNCSGPNGLEPEICKETEECIHEKACCCKPVCWRTRPDGEVPP